MPVLCPIAEYEGECAAFAPGEDCNANDQCQTTAGFCVPKSVPGCISLTDTDLELTDNQLTDSPQVCNRYVTGMIFNRGQGDGVTDRQGDPKCIKGCEGSKYWKNPAYMWGGGVSYDGSWNNNGLQMGPKYLEAAPTAEYPSGWGGEGKLPESLGVPYTLSMGDMTPPCNVSGGGPGGLAGPGCVLTAPDPRFGRDEWSYTCGCPYLGGTGQFRTDADKPCMDHELDQESLFARDVCESCHILDGECVLGSPEQDTKSEILGCIPSATQDCSVVRTVKPTQCPSFCKTMSDKWSISTKCAEQLGSGNWKPNPLAKKTRSMVDPPVASYIPAPKDPQAANQMELKVEIPDQCRNCAQTPMREGPRDYPVFSTCTVGGTVVDSNNKASVTCPSTCPQCMTGYFGEPLEAHYDPNQQIFKDYGVIYTPAMIEPRKIVPPEPSIKSELGVKE